MIDLASENLISLGETPKHLPRRPNGKTIHVSAVYRWAAKGLAGIVLETIRIGGTTYTSSEALQRFGDKLSAHRSRAAKQPTAIAQSRKAQTLRAATEVRAELGLTRIADSSEWRNPNANTDKMHLRCREEAPQPQRQTEVDGSTARIRTGTESTSNNAEDTV